jgi:hypothetical protein
VISWVVAGGARCELQQDRRAKLTVQVQQLWAEGQA